MRREYIIGEADDEDCIDVNVGLLQLNLFQRLMGKWL